MSCRRFAVEYIAKHLNGLTVLAEHVTTGHPVIATHSGSFHCDEALACGLLRHTSAFQGASILRTRDTAQIDKCDIVVDVGAVYDPARHRYDHHQSSFHGTMTTTRQTYQTRLSSAGLVYKHFGRLIIAEYVANALRSPSRAAILTMTGWPETYTTLSEAEIEILFDVIYKNFVEQVDGIDNGVEHYALAEHGIGRLVKQYTQNTTLSDRVGRLHAWWNEPENNDSTAENAAFVEAVELTSSEFFAAVNYYAFSWMPARALVEAAFAKATQVHPSGKIVVFDGSFCPWKDHLLGIEEEKGCIGQVLYVLYSDGKGWRVQAVPKSNSGFENRKPLPYRGLRDQELSDACGIEGGVFVHVSGFIGGMKTYEAALQLAIQALTVE